MINAKCKVMWQPKAMRNAVERGGVKALTKAAAYLRGTARRKVKRRKNKKSAPGHAPYDHGHFKNSVVFAVDSGNIAAYVGPRRTLGRTNASGEIAPQILEFGGMSASGTNSGWIRKKGVPKLTNKNSVAAYFRQIGYGPVFMGKSPTSVFASASRGAKGKDGAASKWKDRIRKKYSTLLKKNVFYLDLKIRSDKMARKAADNTVEYFGYPTIPMSRIAPRPLMGPSLKDSKTFIAQCFRNSMNS